MTKKPLPETVRAFLCTNICGLLENGYVCGVEHFCMYLQLLISQSKPK